MAAFLMPCQPALNTFPDHENNRTLKATTHHTCHLPPTCPLTLSLLHLPYALRGKRLPSRLILLCHDAVRVYVRSPHDLFTVGLGLHGCLGSVPFGSHMLRYFVRYILLTCIGIGSVGVRFV